MASAEMKEPPAGGRLEPPPAGAAAAETADEKIARLEAVAFVLSARIADLESSNAEMRAALKLDPAPPVIGEQWHSIKQTAHDLGISQSAVRKRIAKKKIIGEKHGGRVYCRVPGAR